MLRTNEEIDKINKSREFGGIEKLPYETEGATPATDVAETPEQKELREKAELEEAQKAKDQAELILQEANKIAEQKLQEEKSAQQKLQKENEDKLRKEAEELERKQKIESASDDELRQLLAGRGINVDTLDQLKPVKTEAQLTQEAEQREADKVAYGLQNGLFSKKEYDSYSADINDVEQVVFDDFAADQLAGDSTLTPQEIKDLFEERFGLTAEEGSVKRKRGEKEIGTLGRQIINTKHAKILSLDNQFDNFETSEKSKNAEANKILASAPVYKKDVLDVFDELKTVKVDFGNNEEYEVEVSTEILDELKNQHLVTEFAAAQIKGGWDKARMKETAELAAIKRDFPAITKKIAEKYHLAHAAGTHGIQLPGNQDSASDQKKPLPEAVQDELDRKMGTGKYAVQTV